MPSIFKQLQNASMYRQTNILTLVWEHLEGKKSLDIRHNQKDFLILDVFIIMINHARHSRGNKSHFAFKDK